MAYSPNRWASVVVRGGAIAVLLAGIVAAHPAAAQAVASRSATEAPVGHRQPNAGNVPDEVQRRRQIIDAQEREFDKKLNICRGC